VVLKSDSLFSTPKQTAAFEFDEKVVEVFPDMISRSVPGYAQIIAGIGSLANQFVQERTIVYDLGCSLGAATLSIREQVQQQNYEIIGIDNSAAMVGRCQTHLASFRSPIKTSIYHADILHFDFRPCSFIVINFTLQFLAPDSRAALLNRLYEMLHPGGALILSEKLAFDDDKMTNLFIQQHHLFKKLNGYSELEISQKRAALEQVLLPETLQKHIQRLQTAGFQHIGNWFQQLNFASILAIK